MATTAISTTPRAWIGCLACYNEGRLVGDWFDAVTADEVTRVCPISGLIAIEGVVAA